MILEFDKNCYNPIFWHLQKYINDPAIRYIYAYGGSSAGKTMAITQLLTEKVIEEDCNIKIFRKESTSIWDSVFQDFKLICSKVNEAVPLFDIKKIWIDKGDKSIKFGGMDDPDKVLGISQFKYLYMNELPKFNIEDYREIRRRMRGIPGQKLIADWNPKSETSWIKTEVIDQDAWSPLPNEVEGSPGPSTLTSDSFVWINRSGDSILIKTNHKDNYWCIGHPVPGYGFHDLHALENFEWMRKFCQYDYEVYGLGNWGMVRTGNEFWRSFDVNDHVRLIEIDKTIPIHISIDNNVLPYITVTCWQVSGERKLIRQVGEVICRDPENTATRAGAKTEEWLRKIGYADTVFTYGDFSIKNRNTIDDAKRTFYDLFEEQLKKSYVVRDRVSGSNPAVSLSGEFVNALYSGWDDWTVEIDERCKVSISDYVDVKTNTEGGMLKKKIKDKALGETYEVNGHCSDTKRYVIVGMLDYLYRKYTKKGGSGNKYEIGKTDQHGY